MESNEKMPPNPAEKASWTPAAHEPEHVGPLWKHPYLVYIYLTALLFSLLLFIAWMAWENGWIPSRSIGTP